MIERPLRSLAAASKPPPRASRLHATDTFPEGFLMRLIRKTLARVEREACRCFAKKTLMKF
jgi:hypothetical protein